MHKDLCNKLSASGLGHGPVPAEPCRIRVRPGRTRFSPAGAGTSESRMRRVTSAPRLPSHVTLACASRDPSARHATSALKRPSSPHSKHTCTQCVRGKSAGAALEIELRLPFPDSTPDFP